MYAYCMYWLYLRVDMPFWFGQTHRGRHSMHFEECLRELFAQNWSLPNLRQAEEKRAAVGVSEQPFVPWTHRIRKWCSSQKKVCFTALPGLYHLSSLVFMRKCLLHFVLPHIDTAPRRSSLEAANVAWPSRHDCNASAWATSWWIRTNVQATAGASVTWRDTRG